VYATVFYGFRGMVAVFCRILLLSGFLIVSPAVGRARPGERRVRTRGVQERLVSILIPQFQGPFSATVSTESVRMLADGGRITLVNHRPSRVMARAAFFRSVVCSCLQLQDVFIVADIKLVRTVLISLRDHHSALREARANDAPEKCGPPSRDACGSRA